MKNPTMLSSIPIVLFSCIIALTTGVPAYAAGDDSVILAKGAHTLANPVQHLGEAFTKQNPDLAVIVSGGGSGVGIRALLNAEVDLALAVRELTEEEKSVASEKGLKIRSRAVARDGVAIVTSKMIPVTELTLSEIKKIFTGEIKSWKDVGGPDKPIEVIITDPKRHGTPIFFQKIVMNGEPYRTDCRIERNWEPLLRKVAASDNTFGFCLTEKALDASDEVHLIAVKPDAESPAIPFSWGTIINGTYPICRPVYFYWDGGNEKTALAEFLKFCEEKGVDLTNN